VYILPKQRAEGKFEWMFFTVFYGAGSVALQGKVGAFAFFMIVLSLFGYI
jgi:hypothetical protein